MGCSGIWKTEVRSQESEGKPRQSGGRAQGLLALCLAVAMADLRHGVDELKAGGAPGNEEAFDFLRCIGASLIELNEACLLYTSRCV